MSNISKLNQSPTIALKNITNLQTSQTNFRNCCVKLQKISLETMSSKKLKRKAKENKSTDQDVRAAKKSTVEVQNPSSESVEELIKKYELLQKVISKKYVTVVERLKLDFVPLCAENIAHCHNKHYKKAPPPTMPSVVQVNLLRNSLQQSRYKIFISLVWNLCQSEQFPGDTILTNIIQLLLTLNPEGKFNLYLQPIVDQLLWLFDVILQRFPPCWLAIRTSYIKFLRNTIEMSKLLPDKTLQAQNTIFEVVLMLLEDTIENRDNVKNVRTNNSSKRTKDLNLTYFDDEYHNMQHWEKYDNEQQSFSALSKETRIERLMQVLHLIAKMLEMDLSMWMLRYHKHPRKHIYSDDQPLVITLFSLSSYTRFPVLVKRVISLFALCVQKNLDKHYLKVMERFISLLANVQNLSEIETTPAGITYPYVGPATTSFILDLFKTAEVYMKRDVGSYIRLIKTLRCPFVRYEYIDLFLKRLNPATGKMSPEKIFENFGKNRWLECSPYTEQTLGSASSTKNQSVIYRRDYLEILLDALRSYCEFHGTKECLYAVHSSKIETPVKSSESMSKSNAKEIDLSVLSKNIVRLESKVNMSMVLRETHSEIPLVNIRINSDLFLQYRNDLKFTIILHAYISKLQAEYTEDFSEFIKFLNEFSV